MTGSIFPGIILHAGNNALAAGLGLAGIPVENVPAPVLALGIPAAAGLMWIIYRNRSVYPGD